MICEPQVAGVGYGCVFLSFVYLKFDLDIDCARTGECSWDILARHARFQQSFVPSSLENVAYSESSYLFVHFYVSQLKDSAMQGFRTVTATKNIVSPETMPITNLLRLFPPYLLNDPHNQSVQHIQILDINHVPGRRHVRRIQLQLQPGGSCQPR